MIDDFPFSEDDYLSISDLFFEVAQSLKGKICSDGRKADEQNLALKLFAHAVTAHYLYIGTKSRVPASTNGSSFIDFSSIAVLARASFETYLVFYDVFIDIKNNDEFEFKYCLWNLSGHIVRENFIPSTSDLLADYKIAQEEINSLRNRLRETRKFQSLPIKEQNKILKGKGRQKWFETAKNAGFGSLFTKTLYMYYSGFVHSDGLAAGQLMSTQTGDEQRLHAQIHLTTIMISLSKFILDYASLHNEVKMVCDNHKEVFEKTKEWSEIARKMN